MIILDPRAGRFDPRNTEKGELRRDPAVRRRGDPVPVTLRRRPARQRFPAVRSEADAHDRDPTIRTPWYRFGLESLLKSPWLFLESTRSPVQFKNNSRSAKNLSQNPLSFPVLGPQSSPCLFAC